MDNKEIKSPVCLGWMSGLHANIFYTAKYSKPSSLKTFVETAHFSTDFLWNRKRIRSWTLLKVCLQIIFIIAIKYPNIRVLKIAKENICSIPNFYRLYPQECKNLNTSGVKSRGLKVLGERLLHGSLYVSLFPEPTDWNMSAKWCHLDEFLMRRKSVKNITHIHKVSFTIADLYPAKN